MFAQTASGPSLSPGNRLLLVVTGVHQRGALVEREDDVRAQPMLDLHGELRCEAVLRPVKMRPKGHTVVVYKGQSSLALGDHIIVLEAVGVHGEDLLKAGAERHHLES